MSSGSSHRLLLTCFGVHGGWFLHPPHWAKGSQRWRRTWQQGVLQAQSKSDFSLQWGLVKEKGRGSMYRKLPRLRKGHIAFHLCHLLADMENGPMTCSLRRAFILGTCYFSPYWTNQVIPSCLIFAKSLLMHVILSLGSLQFTWFNKECVSVALMMHKDPNQTAWQRIASLERKRLMWLLVRRKKSPSFHRTGKVLRTEHPRCPWTCLKTVPCSVT